MDIAFEDRIRQRAYEIWQAAGMQGDAEAHWLDAEQHVRTGDVESAAPRAAKAATAKKSAGTKAVAAKATVAGKSRAKTAKRPSASDTGVAASA